MFDDLVLDAAQVARGVGRALDGLGFAHLTEFALPDGRRADVAALGGDGAIWIIEIKISAADFHADRKWTDYEALVRPLFLRDAGRLPRRSAACRSRPLPR